MADKVTLATISTFTNDTSAANTTNANNTLLTAAIDNTLSRDGTSPNSMGANIDMNNNHILNLPAPITPDEPVRLIDMQNFFGTGAITFNGLPTGGVAGNILVKNSSANFDAGWASTGIFTGGTTGQVLTKNSNTNFDFGWQSLPNNTFPNGNGFVFQDTAHAPFNSNSIFVIAPGHDSVVGNGIADDTTAINNILANSSYNEVHVTPGTYKINGITAGVSSKKTIVIHPGAVFSITTGNLLDLSGSVVIAPKNTQCFTLSGTAGVVGLNESTPEMFGAKRDGSTDDSAAINAAISAVITFAANNSIGPNICWINNQGTYLIANPISVTLPTNGRLKIYGYGAAIGGGSIIVAKSTMIASSGALLITGASGSFNDIEVKDIRFLNQTAGAGASIGVFIGRPSSGVMSAPGIGGIKLENVFVSGFGTNLLFSNVSQILCTRCQTWPFDQSIVSTSGSIGTTMIMAGSGAGAATSNIRYDACQFTGTNGNNDSLVVITDQGVANQSAGGIMFNECVFNSGTGKSAGYNPITVSSTGSGSLITGIWFTNCQFFNQGTGVGTCILGTSTNGGQIADFHITSNEFTGNGWATGCQFQATDNISSLGGVLINNNLFVTPTVAAVQINSTASNTASRGFSVCNNTVFYSANCTQMMLFNNLQGDVVCNNNCGFTFASPTITTGINFTGTGNRAIALGNNTRATTPTAVGSWTNTVTVNNL